MIGVDVSVRNHFNDTLVSYRLTTGSPLYSIPVVLPTASPSLSPSPAAAAAASSTASPSATLSAGAVPSASPTAAASAAPVAVRVRTVGNNALAFSELLAFSPTGRLLNVGAGTVATSSVPGSNPSLAADFCWDAWIPLTCRPYAADVYGSSSWTNTWPVPSAVATLYFVNRGGGGTNATKIVQDQAAVVEVLNQFGAVTNTFPITSTQTVSSFTVGATVTPVYPDLAAPEQTSDAARSTLVRFVRLSTTTQYLHFRELMVFDATNTNVALNKPVTGSAQYMLDGNIYLLRNGNNGVITMDDAVGDMTVSAALGAFWQVDL